MDVGSIIDKFEECVKTHGFHLWYGSKASYEGKSDFYDREVILEPFSVKMTRSNDVFHATNFTIWVLVKIDRTAEKENERGIITKHYDNIIEKVSTLYDEISSSGYFLVHKKKEEVEVMINHNSSMNQIIAKFEIPIRLYETN